VPERSVEVRVDEMSPSPAPHPPSSRTSPTTSPARTHAPSARRPVRTRSRTGHGSQCQAEAN
jgi:hypothetical protein